MDIQDMRSFQTIAEEGNISKAAKRLNISQSPLSRKMQQLENRLGVQLFERGSRRIKLTEAGQLLLARTEQLLELVDITINELTEINSGLGGNISIGMVPTSGAAILPNVVGPFHSMYPNVKFQIWQGDSSRIFELLDNKVVEIGIIRIPFDSNYYDSILLPEEPFVIAMKKDASCGEDPECIRLIELANQPLIIPRNWKNMFVDCCSKVGFLPNIVSLSGGYLDEIILVKSSIGMALMPDSVKQLISYPDLTLKTITEPTLSTQSAILWLRNGRLSTTSKHFLDLISEYVLSTEEFPGLITY